MMKNFILAIATFFVGTSLFGQTVPKGIAYQAVAINTEAQSVAGINPENTYWSNKDIQVRFTIYDQYPGGTAQMVETHQTKTDKFGVFNLVIGQGQNVSGDLFDVEWDKGQAHLQVEIDFKNNGLYKLIGIERFWSVPYAFNSQSSDAITANLDSLNADLNDKISKNKDRINNHIQNDLDTNSEDEIQFLNMNGDTVFISGGNHILLPNDEDIDSTNEIQEITLKGDEIVISKSLTGIKIDSLLKHMNINTIRDTLLLGVRKIFLSDLDSINEIQTIGIKGDTITLTKGGGEIVLPEDKVFDGDSSVVNEIQDLYVENDTIKISKSTSDGIAIDDLRKILDSLSTSKSGGSTSTTSKSGVNGIVDDMWFGVNFQNTNLIHLHGDTGYFHIGNIVIREKPSGVVDTLFSVGHNRTQNLWMHFPYLYSNYAGSHRIFHVDSGFIRKINGVLGTGLSNGNTVHLEQGRYSFDVGNLKYYNFKKDTTLTINNPDYNRNGKYTPQRINDSMVLIGPRVWKYYDDTIVPTNQTLALQWEPGNYSSVFNVPMTGNGRYIIFDRLDYQSKGTSAGWWRTLRVHDVMTGKSRVIESLSNQSTNPGAKYNFFGVSQNKALIIKDGNVLWLDLENLTLIKKDYRQSGQIIKSTTRSAYKRPGLKVGTETTYSGFKYEYYPNLNYTKPTKGSIWLHY
ncbi:MAG: hypothetical protein ACON5K_11470 [Bacteroidia bacterium]